jgi:thermostable 8-oxoguanine DNA glycosylase
MLLSRRTVKELQRVARSFAGKAKVPPRHRWKRLTNDAIWRHVVTQIAVVGSAASGARIEESDHAQEALRFEILRRVSPNRRREIVNKVLRDCGVRFASADARQCRKTAAVLRNFEFLAAQPGGPAGYLRFLAGLPSDAARVSRLAADMSYIKLKGARDLLAELGLVTDIIALDARVLNILRHAGAVLPSDIQTNGRRYAALESELLRRVCEPIGITGVALDRTLFQEYKAILGRLRAAPDLDSASARSGERRNRTRTIRACTTGRSRKTRPSCA